MELLLLVFFCLLTGSEVTFGAGKTVIIAKVGSDVTLPCSLREDITNKKFEWKKDGRQVFLYDDGDHSNIVNTGQDQQFKGRVSYFRDELKSGIASITISNTQAADSGLYTCEFPDLQPRQIFHMKLIVAGEAPQPSVRTLNQTQFSAVLQCEVRGAFPKPELHWEDSDGNILPAEEPQESKREGLYDIFLITTVTKTDYYRCVATQKEINQTTHDETYVYFPERDILDEIKAVIRGTKDITVREGSDVTLPCSLNTTDITHEKFVWKKDGRQVFLYDAGDHSNNAPTGQDQQFVRRVSYFRDELKSGIASITIRDTKVADRGLYTCEFPDHPGEIFLVVLDVGAAKPSVTILDQTKFSATLQCEGRGAFPKPKLHWEDGAGNILPAEEPQESEREGLLYISLKTTVYKTGIYRCVATYAEINHQTDSDIDMHIPDGVDAEILDKVRELTVAETFGIYFVVAAVLAVVGLAVYRRRDRIKSCCMKAPNPRDDETAGLLTEKTAPTAPGNETAGPTNETDVASPLNGNSTNEVSRV